MVLMAVRDHDTAQLVAILLHIREIRQYKVDAEHIFIWKGHAAVDDEHIVHAFVNSDVLADLQQTTERNDAHRRLTLLLYAAFLGAPGRARRFLLPRLSRFGKLDRRADRGGRRLGRHAPTLWQTRLAVFLFNRRLLLGRLLAGRLFLCRIPLLRFLLGRLLRAGCALFCRRLGGRLLSLFRRYLLEQPGSRFPNRLAGLFLSRRGALHHGTLFKRLHTHTELLLCQLSADLLIICHKIYLRIAAITI